MLYFAYGSNMHGAVMRRHAPGAEPIGVARLADYRFVITADGYASVAPAPADVVYGLLWRLTPQDRATLDAWENVAGGLYGAETLPVRIQMPLGSQEGSEDSGEDRHALVYIACRQVPGQPRQGYMEVLIKAAQELELPPDYIAVLASWLQGPVDEALPRFGDFR